MEKESIYEKLIDRNIGLLTLEQQDKLKKTCVAVFGLGGLGGIIAQILARCGIGRMKIVDNDRFEATNLNRQIFCYISTLHELKVDATERFLKDINPEIIIEKYTKVDETSISSILDDVHIALLAIDKTKPCIIISRSCRAKGIPLVEGWAIPFGNVRVFTLDTISLEQLYQLPTQGYSLEELVAENDNFFASLDSQVLMSLSRIQGIDEFYRPEVAEQIFRGEKITSFAPMVWLTAVLMALEATKVILNWGDLAKAPSFALYDPYKHIIPEST